MSLHHSRQLFQCEAERSSWHESQSRHERPAPLHGAADGSTAAADGIQPIRATAAGYGETIFNLSQLNNFWKISVHNMSFDAGVPTAFTAAAAIPRISCPATRLRISRRRRRLPGATSTLCCVPTTATREVEAIWRFDCKSNKYLQTLFSHNSAPRH